MAEPVTKLAVKTEDKNPKPPAVLSGWEPLDTLRRQIDRVFESFHPGFWRAPAGRAAFDLEPLWRFEGSWGGVPVVDWVDKEQAYEITAELPGLDQKDVEVALSNGTLTIKGEKNEEKEEKKKDYYLSERRYGAFQRSFRVPEDVDADKVAATFAKGVLTVTLPKTPAAQKNEKKIAIKAA